MVSVEACATRIWRTGWVWLFLAVQIAISSAAAAQASSQTSSRSSTGADEEVLMQADELTYDRDAQLVTAIGHVELAFGDRVLMADKMTYDQTTGVVVAEGDVALVEPSGDIAFADRMVLTDGLREGVVDMLSALLVDESRLAGARAKRTDGNITTLYRAVYSPCEVCNEEGKRTPLWRIRAFKVIHNKEQRQIIYEDAFMEFFGIPVAYVPFFSHPDPSVKRKSGFLTPSIANSSDLGLQVEVPYFWAIQPNLDVTLAPRYTSEQGLVYNAEFRHRIAEGKYRLNFIGTNPRTAPAGEDDFRGALFGEGDFRLAPRWTAGYRAELTTDDTFLRRYDITNDTDLFSNIYLQRQDGRNQFSANAYYFQGLLSSDDSGETPYVAPILDYRHAINTGGSRLRFNANFLNLARTDGADSRRLVGQAHWNKLIGTPSGQQINAFANLRGDIFVTKDVANPLVPGATFGTNTVVRAVPTVGVEWRWPFIRRGTSVQQVIEPIAQLIYTADVNDQAEIPNEDSLSFEFDDTNLFSENRFPGYDRVETGGRANVGVQYSVYTEELGSASVMFGQVLRFEDEDIFTSSTGLDGTLSDYVGRVTLAPTDSILIAHRFRLDQDEFDFERNEVDVSASYRGLGLTLGYGFFDRSLSETLGTREEIFASARYRLTDYWSINGTARRDLQEDRSVRYTAGVGYADECFAIDFRFIRDFTRDRDIEPSNSIFLRFSFKNLGETDFQSALGP